MNNFYTVRLASLFKSLFKNMSIPWKNPIYFNFNYCYQINSQRTYKLYNKYYGSDNSS